MNPQDLFNDIKAMKAQLDELSKRPAPATAEQLAEVTDRPITLDAKSFAQHVLPDLKKGLPDTVAIEQAADKAASKLTQTADQAFQRFEQTAQRIPRHVRVTGDIYGFTTFYAALGRSVESYIIRHLEVDPFRIFWGSGRFIRAFRLKRGANIVGSEKSYSPARLM